MSYRRKPKNTANREADVLPTPLSETPEFLAYEKKVERLVLKTKRGITHSEIERVLQPPHPHATAIALERLFATVEKREVGAFTKYFPRELRKTPNPAEDNYHAGLFTGKPTKKDWPYPESVVGEI